MTRGRALWFAIALLAATAAGAAWLHSQKTSERPGLAILTSLPLLFGEQFGLDQKRAEGLSAIERDFTLHPIATTEAANLAGQDLLLMAHARAQPAEGLVALDTWVRGGGKMLLLAEPRLDWESSLPLGDRLRPPPFFVDTGLLTHWGMTLRSPESDEAGAAGKIIVTSKACEAFLDGAGARCRIGQGEATIIADADLLIADDAALERSIVAEELKRMSRSRNR